MFIEEILFVPPQELSDPETYIRTQLQKRLYTCEKDVGYITAIEQVKLHSNTICVNTGGCKVKVSFDLTSILPTPGNVYHACIQLLLPDGMFCRFHEIPILIARDQLEDWTFDSNTFVKGDHTLAVGDWVSVQVTSARFENNEYQCLGRLT